MAELRQCIGSKRYGIERHEAPVEDFPAQPSQKDGLGRMCRTHWNEYTRGLARDAKARRAAAADKPSTADPEPADPEPGDPAPNRASPPRRGKPEPLKVFVSRRKARHDAVEPAPVEEVPTPA